MEISKNKIKYFSTFAKKKARDEAGFFVVEGNKMVAELLNTSWEIVSVVATSNWLENHTIHCDCYTATHDDICKISLLQNPQEAWALVRKKAETAITSQGLILALDDVQDPGNLGTIIRLADWFGIEQIICSQKCADIYNPKVVQATMGAIFRTKINYVNLPEFLDSMSCEKIIADMDGENVYTATLPQQAILIMGNEGNGISPEVAQRATRSIHIPSFNASGTTSESLNVAVATAILCSEFKRRTR